MKISIEKNIVFINGTQDLKRYQVSQIEYFEYKKNDGAFFKTSDSVGHEISKITKYLDEEEVVYELSDEAILLLSKLNEKSNELREVLVTAKKIKEDAI